MFNADGFLSEFNESRKFYEQGNLANSTSVLLVLSNFIHSDDKVAMSRKFIIKYELLQQLEEHLTLEEARLMFGIALLEAKDNQVYVLSILVWMYKMLFKLKADMNEIASVDRMIVSCIKKTFFVDNSYGKNSIYIKSVIFYFDTYAKYAFKNNKVDIAKKSYERAMNFLNAGKKEGLDLKEEERAIKANISELTKTNE